MSSASGGDGDAYNQSRLRRLGEARLGILERLGLRRFRCPRCGSTNIEARSRVDKEYVASEHQAYESTAGWVYGHKVVHVSFRECGDCCAEFALRRRVIKEEKARGATGAKRFGGYGTD